MIERIEINLLPAEYRFHKRKFRIQREMIYPLLGVILTGVVLVFWTLFQENSISYNNGQISFLSQQIEQNRPIQNEINMLRSDKMAIQEKIRALERISVSREKWVKLMEELSGRLPQYTWLLSVKEENTIPPVLSIEGRTYSFPEVANYMSNLKESKYISSVGLTDIEQISSKEKMYKFSITCSLNQDVNMTPVQNEPSPVPGVKSTDKSAVKSKNK
ncbi:MAG: PilN domain-containing protein [Fibrobacterota bacterium]|nr:PilN domain-containing protein [Chitinispirillaceae bacterium]